MWELIVVMFVKYTTEHWHQL